MTTSRSSKTFGSASWWMAAMLLGVFLAGRVAAATTQPAPVKSAQDAVTVDARTEAVIRGALKFLANEQSPPDGSWSGDHKAAITGYVLMAFLSAGELPNEGEYGKNVNKAKDYLLGCCRPDGYIAASAGSSNMYGHGIATIALAELYGETYDPALRPKLDRAIKLIISCQNEQGGWRYQPKVMPGDISVTVLQCVALRAAQNAGIAVPQSTIDKAVFFVKSCSDVSGGFDYQPHTNAPGFARTAAAIYSLQVCGLYDDKMVKVGSDFLLKSHDQTYFTYGNFYAAPAQYMIGGETWKRWYEQINTKLMATVRNDSIRGGNYWDPIDGGQGVSPVYATAVYTTILAVPYHYLPLYQR